MSAGFLLARYGGALSIEARKDGLYATTARSGVRISDPTEWPSEWLDSPQALQAALQFSRLAELGLAEEASGVLRVSYHHFPELFAKAFTLPLIWSNWSPFTLSLSTQGSLVDEHFRLDSKFMLGDMAVWTERQGRYVRRVGHSDIWLLDDLTFHLIEHLETWRSGEARWIDYAFVKEYAAGLCAEMDDYLRNNDVVFPTAVYAKPAGKLGSRPEPVINEIPERTFRTAVHSVVLKRRLLVHVPQGSWVHLIFDDAQLEFLRTWSPAVQRPTLNPPCTLTGQGAAGRTGCRETTIDSQIVTVPARLPNEIRVLEGLAQAPGGSALYDRAIESMRRSQLETLVACWYGARGFRVILAPEHHAAGASVIAVQDGVAWLVRVETVQAGLEALDTLTRIRLAYERLYSHPYRLALIVRNQCGPELVSRARAAHIELKDGVQLVDEIESHAISSEDLGEAERHRSRCMRDVVESLQLLLDSGRS